LQAKEGSTLVAEVLINRNHPVFRRTYDYRVPASMEQRAAVGERVALPFGTDTEMGYIVGLKDTAEVPVEKLKDLIAYLDEKPILTAKLLAFADDVAGLYGVSRITALKTVLPLSSALKKELTYIPGEGISPEDAATLRAAGPKNRKALYDAFGEKTAKAFLKSGAIREAVSFSPKVKEKTHLGYYARDWDDEVLETLPDEERGIYDYVLLNPGSAYPELREAIGASRYRLDKLVQKLFLEKKLTPDTRDPFYAGAFLKAEDHALTGEQEAALGAIEDSFRSEPQKPVLLFGVTGSGKTLIYEKLIEKTLNAGKTALLLVPEISLIPQVYGRFVARFGDTVSVLHSGLSEGERFDQLMGITAGKKRLVIGARSAVFAPLSEIGIIILDEEHEDSFKEEGRYPRYHALEVARLLCRRDGSHLLLGSATPSMESYARAKSGAYGFVQLKERALGAQLPTVKIIDMRKEPLRRIGSLFSEELKTALVENYRAGMKSILLLNRRGYYNFILCRHCGEVLMCPHCDVPLRYHKGKGRLLCHYCGHEEVPRGTCPRCGKEGMRPYGSGTERVEEELQALLPGSTIVRMDRDTTSGKDSHTRLLSRFLDEGDVLIGTQMIAKGLDVEKVTLVGVLSVDSTLRLSGFKAAEKTFSLINQVSGRAGRGKYPGKVLLQTYDPDHYAVKLAAENRYEDFAREELSFRKRLSYPPYTRFFTVEVSGKTADLVHRDAVALAAFLKRKFSGDAVLGPAPSDVYKVKDVFREQVVLKTRESIPKVMAALSFAEEELSGKTIISPDRM